MARSGKGSANLWVLLVGLPLGLAFIVAMVFVGLSYPLYTIPSESNVPTLLNGDLILTRGSKLVCGAVRPQPGDVVVFRHKDTSYVKRLVGLPGEWIQFKHGVLWIDGRPVPQTAEGHRNLDLGGFQTQAEIVRETLPNGKSYQVSLVDRTAEPENTGEYVLPAGQYFVVGDSRDNSLDSRFPKENDGVGFVPAENLCAVAIRVLSSPDRTHVWKAL